MHGHHHQHDRPSDFGRAFQIGIVLNVAFVAVELMAGFWFSSVSLLADAGHNLSDVFGLAIAFVAFRLAQRKPTERFTYGLGSTTIMASAVNGAILMFAVGAITWEAVRRLFEPAEVVGGGVLAVAIIGVIINSLTAALFFRGRDHDLNVKGAFLHMLADAVVSLGVVVAGGLILATGWTWVDPVVSLLIAAVILAGTWGLLRDSLAMLNQGVPAGIELPAVEEFLSSREGVLGVHDLHVWALSTTRTALSAHLVCRDGIDTDGLLKSIAGELQERFQIAHPTLQIEYDAIDAGCGEAGSRADR